MLAHEPDDEVDDALLAAAIVASLRLRLLVLDETLQPFADQLHDGVDDTLLFELAVPPSAAAVIAIVLVAAVLVASMVVAAAVAPIAIATAVLVPAPVLPGTRTDQALERL